MNQLEFTRLSIQQQKEITWQYGFVMGVKKDNKYEYVLYSINDFFVMIQYNGKSINSIQSFSREQKIRMYPSNIPTQLRQAS